MKKFLEKLRVKWGFKKFKCHFHLLDYEDQKIHHPNHDAYYPVMIFHCLDCGFFRKKEIEKVDWEATGYIEDRFWGNQTIYKKVEKPYYEDKKIWDGK